MTVFKYRLESLRETLPSLQIDGLLVTNPTNIRWLSGFTGSYGRLLINQKQAVLATDARYWIQARKEAPDYELFKDIRRAQDTLALLNKGGVGRVGIEANHVTLAAAEELNGIEGFTCTPLQNTVEEFRQFKNGHETSIIHAAAAITDNAMALVPQLAKAGISERELAWLLEKAMREAGADGIAFPIIVAFGPNSALPHHNPGDRTLKEEEIVLVDMGAELNGYKSDLTRSFYYGRQNDRFQTIFDLVLAAQTSALRGVCDGKKSNEVHQAAIDVIAEGGYGDYFGHGLGHGVGLDIHELPYLSVLRTPVDLSTGMIITVEPGIYLQEWGGVRIEDLVSITDDGLEYHSNCPKEPYIHP